MTAATADIDARAAGLGLFEKWLSVWVGGAILAGIALGNTAPERIRLARGHRIRLGQSCRRSADLGDDLPDDGRGRFRRGAPRR